MEEKYKEIIEPHKILEEKGFQFPPQPSGITQTLYDAVARRGWQAFCKHPRDHVMPLIKELYANMIGQSQQNIWIRNSLVPLNPRVINAFYKLPSNVDCEYSKLIGNMTTQKWNKVLKTLTVEGESWADEEGE